MDTLDWLTKLVACDTTSRHSNLSLIEMVADYLSTYGMNIRYTYNEGKTKANLFATVGGQKKQEGGLILSGHTDVVPVDGQNWESNPFQVRIQEGRAYGRGTADMKGFIACVLKLVPYIIQLKLNYPVHIALSFDEEIGCLGAPLLIKDFLSEGCKPAACIVGEPSNMRPVLAHKGIEGYHCQVMGKAAHSSLTAEGCNAIAYASHMIVFLQRLAEDLKTTGQQDPHFDVPYSTLSVNLIDGGTAGNIIPAHCEFFFDLRHLPNEPPRKIINKIENFIDQELLPLMLREFEQGQIQLQKSAGVPSFSAAKEAAFPNMVLNLMKEQEVLKVAYATEAGQFQSANIQTVVCGPGNIQQAHKPNEFIALQQLELCVDFLKKLLHEYEG